MKGTPAIYLGRIVDKEHFRAFIYSADGQRKLVESWEEFEATMQTGLWFATKEDAMASIPVCGEEVGKLDEPVMAPDTIRANAKSRSRVKAKPVSKPKPVAIEDTEEGFQGLDDEMCFEVKGDLV